MGEPLNKKIYNHLIKKIHSGYYKKGDKLPTEKEMMEIYDVSRAPIRQALSRLQTAGYIERKPGIGSVIINTDENEPAPLSGGFESSFNMKWDELECKTINVERIIPDNDVKKGFNLTKDNETAIKVQRIRFEKEKPIFLLENFYDERLVDFEIIKNIGDIKNMRMYARKTLGLEMTYVTEEIRAVGASNEVSYHLQVDVGFPLLQIFRTSYDSKFQPVEFVKYHVNSEDWPYRIIYDEQLKEEN